MVRIGVEDRRRELSELLTYLFRKSEFRYESREPPPVDRREGDRWLPLESGDLSEFLAADGIWILPRAARRQIFCNVSKALHARRAGASDALLCNKLATLYSAARMARQEAFGELVQVFGHDIGNSFKESNAVAVLADLYRYPERVSSEIMKGTLSRLLPIWGLSQTIRAVAKKDGMLEASDLGGWVEPHLPEHLSDTMASSLRALVRQVYLHPRDKHVPFPWRVITNGAEENWSHANEPADDRLQPLGLFKNDDRVYLERTLPVTAGLLELLRNVRAYPTDSLAEEAARGRGLTVRVVVDTRRLAEEGASVTVFQPHLGEKTPHSDSLARIRTVEETVFRKWVETRINLPAIPIGGGWFEVPHRWTLSVQEWFRFGQVVGIAGSVTGG